MKKTLLIILLIPTIVGTSFAQEKYLEFEKEIIHMNNDRFAYPDSLSISYSKCIAFYDYMSKSSIAHNYVLVDLLKNTNPKLSRIIKRINSSCTLYQENKDGTITELDFNWYNEDSNLKKGTFVECNITIVTLYKELYKRDVRIITSMKKLK